MKRCRFSFIGWALLGVLCCVGVTNCARSPKLSGGVEQPSFATMSNRLRQVWFGLRSVVGDRVAFPNDLSGLDPSILAEDLFLVPGTGSEPGTFKTIHEWTDFIYVGNSSLDVPFAALVISPPENHHGQYGCVLCVGGSILKLPPAEILRVVQEPWCLATNAPVGVIDEERKRIVVHIPERFRLHYAEGSFAPTEANVSGGRTRRDHDKQ